MPAEEVDLGTCCCCGGTKRVRNIIMLSRKAPKPGTGWGCVVCGLPGDGASAVVCDRCLNERREISVVIDGMATAKGRIAVDQFAFEHFDHDMSKHEPQGAFQ